MINTLETWINDKYVQNLPKLTNLVSNHNVCVRERERERERERVMVKSTVRFRD